MKMAILASWNISFHEGKYYIRNTHFSYLKFLADRFEEIYLITSVLHTDRQTDLNPVERFPNIKVVELPYVAGFARAQILFNHFRRAIKSVAGRVDFFYCRVPDPFSWMPRLMFGQKCVMHYTGDTIDATRHNERWGRLKKKIMIAGYLPDYGLTLSASRSSRVYTNGHHIAEKLARRKVAATAVISSTVSLSALDGRLRDPMEKEEKPVRLIYLGYTRNAKGMSCLMDIWTKLRDAGTDFIFDVVGDGAMLEELREFVAARGLEGRVVLHGRKDDKEEINAMLRNADLFIFPSLSEGSPRVVIEAMAQGLPVVSTPVGSLPRTFRERETIRFFDFNDAAAATDIIMEYVADRSPFIKQREAAYCEVKEKYTIEAFLTKVFSYDEK